MRIDIREFWSCQTKNKGLLEACAERDVCILCLQGVIVYFRVVDGELKPGDTIRLINTGKEYEVDEVGVLSPKQIPVRLLAFDTKLVWQMPSDQH